MVVVLSIFRIRNPICKDYAYYYDSSIERRIRWPKVPAFQEEEEEAKEEESRNLNRIFSLFPQIKPSSRIE